MSGNNGSNIIGTDAVVVGASPVGLTYARKLVDAGIAAHMVQIKEDIDQGSPYSSLLDNAWPSGQNAGDTLDSRWTFCAARQDPTLERSALFNDKEWDALYAEAEARTKIDSTVFEDSIRHQLVKRTLQSASYERGARDFVSMAPLRVQKRSGQHSPEWSSSAVVLGDIYARTTKTDGRSAPVPGSFTLHSGALCTKLQHPGRSDGDQVEGAFCKDLKSGNDFLRNDFLLMAKVYVICAGGVSTPGGIHKKAHPIDPIPIPSTDLDPQVNSPASERYPWHAQIYRNNAAAKAATATEVDSRVVVDLRWSTCASGNNNKVTFSDTITERFGIPAPTFDVQFSENDDGARRPQAMMQDMCSVANMLSQYGIGGTTRAGTSRADSICDKYGRVWGTDNVVVGGCNIVPSGSTCDPTLTAIGFAIVGADKIMEKLAPNKAAVTGKN
ncbi:hypothetical protein PG994_002350 [Apiospora phragmitis]|uniref:Glucose-methanol-choline oxidoreductase C-terminal domain-containing protein n=1 Tax=Apiospora phragmitis TaxID=2905665 RepID=A0ABR1WW64_9PEZI